MQPPARVHSDQRIAEAVRVAPYLTHVVRHHGRLTLIPPDNAGRVRKARHEKSIGRLRAERPARSTEEPHFNTGVSRLPRLGPVASPTGRARQQGNQDRRRNEANGGEFLFDC